MSDYDIQSYLLDRANIHDVITKMSLYLDLKRFTSLASDVFADKMQVDYSSLLGGEPYELTGEKQAVTWMEQLGGMDCWQHVTTSILIELPQPGKGVGIPKNAGALANCVARLERREARGGPEASNGGRYDLEVIRTNKSGNPWRISRLKADVVWFAGNMGVYEGVENKPAEG
ncbi:SnoaL-like domain-containing protein [Amylocarpus encephaloides]|uniref:SnoaL-like domain-containing protein n=1 Tax=Amylocarpus encephaloides TaxID=45428 RepID=A0A9P7YMB0_9HELO|nr:SnoaL-like domain-containing protein [Amylocarpus encephaloides]